MDQDQKYEIITRFFCGTISESEACELEEWKAESPANSSEFDDLAELWRRTGTIRFPQKINISKALGAMHDKSGIGRDKPSRFPVLWQIAAILVLALLISGVYSYFLRGGNPGNDYFREVKAAYGTRTTVELPDGSVVLLNSGSSLRFQGGLGHNKQRKVKLQGEGYFSVAKDKEKPFIVEIGGLSVEALGTAFNVDAYNPDVQIEVALIEGKVVVATDGDAGEQLILNPGQLARLDVASRKLSKEIIADGDRSTGWTEGKMVFADDPIREVMRRMENWYNVDISLKDECLLKYRFTGTFVDESLEEILNAFSLTSPLHYEIEPAVKNSEGIYSRRKVILKSNK